MRDTWISPFRVYIKNRVYSKKVWQHEPKPADVQEDDDLYSPNSIWT